MEKLRLIIGLLLCGALFTFCNPISQLGKDLSYSKSLSHNLSNTGQTTLQFIDKEINRGLKANILMPLSYTLGGSITMYEVTHSRQYLAEAFDLANRVVATATVVSQIPGNLSSFDDSYMGFLNVNPNYSTDKRGGPHMMEVPLYESYFYRYLAKLLYVYHYAPKKIKDNTMDEDYSALLNFLIKNGWEKWYTRGELESDCMPYLFRNRTHMTSHWGTVALYLSELNTDATSQMQYNRFLDALNWQLKDNLKLSKQGGYIWNMTWDNDWPNFSNCNRGIKNGILQDGDHGNHVISYVVEAYEMGKYWAKSDIERFVESTQNILFDSIGAFFYADFERKYDESYLAGLRYADGFLKLARYDKQLFLSFDEARLKQKEFYHFRYSQSQYIAEYRFAKQRQIR